MDDTEVNVAEWLPDLPAKDNPGCTIARNVLPITTKSYAPVPGFKRSIGAALPSTPLGAFAAKDDSGNPAIYAGTLNDLWVLDNGVNPNFKKVSSSAGAYNVPSGSQWDFEIFDGAVYASNGSDPVQSALVADDAVNFATVDANAPKAHIIKAIQPGFLLCGDINDVTVGIQPAGVRWGALAAAGAGAWPLIGSDAAIAVQSDWQKVRGAIGRLKAIAPNLSSCNAALFFEQSIFKMLYTGDAAIFDIQPVEKVRGTPAARSVITLGQVAYFLSHDGFYAYDGSQAVPIGANRINQFFFKDADPNFRWQAQGTADPLNGCVYWAYAGVGNAGIPNRVLVFNTIINRWGWIDGFSGTTPLIGLAFGTSLDAIDALGYNIDTLPFSLDSEILTGGAPFLAAFDASNFFGYFTGANLDFTVELGEKQLIPGARARIAGVRPNVDSDAVSVALGIRDRIKDSPTYTGAVAPNAEGTAPFRTEGRFARVQLIGAAGNQVTHISGAQLRFGPGSRRSANG